MPILPWVGLQLSLVRLLSLRRVETCVEFERQLTYSWNWATT